jgi:hypothetical protein
LHWLNLGDGWEVFKIWLVIPWVGNIRLSTIATFASIFFYVLWKFRKQRKIAFYHALVTVAFTASLYEIIFNIFASQPTLESISTHLWIWQYLALGGWFIVGFKQAKDKFVLRRSSFLLICICLAAWGSWLFIGFPYNVHGGDQLNLAGEAFNIITKTTLPFGYAFGLQPDKCKRWQAIM